MTGEPTIMPIQLTGPAPFKLTYAVQLGEEQKAFMVHLRRERGLAQSKRIGHVCTDTTVPAACLRRHIRPGGQLDNLRAGPTAIQVEGVTVRGRYRVLLRQVTDGVGCTADAQQERTIVADRVTASLVCSASSPGAPMRAGEGSKLALALAGGVPPYHVDYRTPQSAASTVLTFQRAPYGLPLTVSGVYTLVSVRDAQCAGTVETPTACAVDVVAKPTVMAKPLVTEGALRNGAALRHGRPGARTRCDAGLTHRRPAERAAHVHTPTQSASGRPPSLERLR